MAQTFKLNANWQLAWRDLGLQPSTILRRARMPLDLFSRDHISLSAEEYFGLWRAMEEEMGDRLLPLEVGQGFSIEAFDPALFAALCSPDLNTATQRLSKYKPLIGPFTLDVNIGTDQTTLTYGSSVTRPLLPSLGMMELVFLVAFARRATRMHIRPLRVTTPDPVASAAAYEDFFGIQMRRGSTYSVTIAARDAKRPFLTANVQMWRFFEPILDQRLEEIERKATIAERVYAALFEMLPSGRRSVQEVSSTLGMSTRSLQRYLRQEGTNFQQVLNQTREQLARHYLEHSAMTGAEISFLLGYDDPNSFFRAFRTWTGQTPETLRASLSAVTLAGQGTA